MRVGVLFTSNQAKGGVYQYSMSVINSLIQNNQISELTVYTNNKNFIYQDIKISYVSNYMILLSLFFGILNFFPKILFKNSDLIIAPSYSPLLFMCSPKFVFTLHDLQELYYPNFLRKEVKFWRNFMYKRLTKLAYRIITESNHVKKDIIKMYKNTEDKVHVIESPPYFKIEEIKKSPFHFSYIFFPAQFWKHKNHIRVIMAFKKIKKFDKEIKLVLTGSKSREFKKIKNKVLNLNLENDVIFRGPIHQTEMSTYFSNAKLIIVPTLYESISIPVFEAFKYQVPVCSSGIYAIKDQVGNAGIFFNPENISSIYTAIKKGLTDKNLRIKCIENGKRRLDFFSQSRFNNLLNKALNEN